MRVPPASHPIWAELLNSKSAFQPSFLAARMLIVRYRMEMVKTNHHPSRLEEAVARLRELYAESMGSTSADQDLARLFG
jgi:hypothetical protein